MSVQLRFCLAVTMLGAIVFMTINVQWLAIAFGSLFVGLLGGYAFTPEAPTPKDAPFNSTNLIVSDGAGNLMSIETDVDTAIAKAVEIAKRPCGVSRVYQCIGEARGETIVSVTWAQAQQPAEGQA